MYRAKTSGAGLPVCAVRVLGRLRVGNNCAPVGVCVVASLSPRWSLFSFHFLPTACAVGCILMPLRGSTELAGPLLGRRASYDTDSSGAESAWCFAAQKTLAQDDQVL